MCLMCYLNQSPQLKQKPDPLKTKCTDPANIDQADASWIDQAKTNVFSCAWFMNIILFFFIIKWHNKSRLLEPLFSSWKRLINTPVSLRNLKNLSYFDRQARNVPNTSSWSKPTSPLFDYTKPNQLKTKPVR